MTSILLVDDREENLMALEAVLAPLGHNLVRANSGAQALKHLLTGEFALVLLDVEMPNLDGYETATYIKQRAKTSALPIIFITAVNKERHDVFRGYTAGAVDYVLKPVDPEILRSKVSVFVDLHLKETALHESEERFRRAFDDAPIGMGLISPDGHWLRVNRALCTITGCSERSLMGQGLAELIHPNDQPANAHGMHEVFAGKIESYKLEQRYRHAEGHFVWVVVSASGIRDAARRPLYLIAQVEDITGRKRAEAELTHQALHDSLTGLGNRALFLDHLEVAVKRLQRRASSVAVLFVDIDRFKVVNDSLGHERGDELLCAFGKRVQGLMRPADTVARFGGDEFTILCEESDERAAVGVAQRVLDAVAQPFEVGSAEVFVTASIGIVVSSDINADIGHLVTDADAAMYRAKENGKARYELFDNQMRARAMQRLATENALHRALDRAELRLFYQPVVDLDTGTVRGVEALLRWEHPQRGLIRPGEFVPVAEETGLIVPIGRWAIEGACRQLKRWQRDCPGPPLQLSVNLSGRQFVQPDLVGCVSNALHNADLEPSLLCLEVTETVLLQDSEQTLTVLAGLKALGVQIAIDDFGTGYSSLSYLKRFAVDVLKVDKGFVDGLSRDPHNSLILAAVVSLAEALGVSAVAEGIETGEQRRELLNLGFKSAQGFYFARPQPAGAIREMLRTRKITRARQRRSVPPKAKRESANATHAASEARLKGNPERSRPRIRSADPDQSAPGDSSSVAQT
jgi:diguanylate cyclase (GGDEF)-like protein/PAS domain S-box-containing protein